MPLYDCTDPGSVDPPAQPEPQQYETDFSEEEAGEAPSKWSTLWQDSEWTVVGNPKRLIHSVTGPGRRALTLDEAGAVRGDIEVSGLVRSHTEGSLFQLHLHGSGSAGDEASYYLDIYNGVVRINRYLDGRYRTLEAVDVPFSLEEHSWYHVVLQREMIR